jgi:hypothetical protein
MWGGGGGGCIGIHEEDDPWPHGVLELGKANDTRQHKGG